MAGELRVLVLADASPVAKGHTMTVSIQKLEADLPRILINLGGGSVLLKDTFQIAPYDVDELCKRLQAAKVLISSPPSSSRPEDWQEVRNLEAEAKPQRLTVEARPVIITPTQQLGEWLKTNACTEATIRNTDGIWTCTLFGKGKQQGFGRGRTQEEATERALQEVYP